MNLIRRRSKSTRLTVLTARFTILVIAAVVLGARQSSATAIVNVTAFLSVQTGINYNAPAAPVTLHCGGDCYASESLSLLQSGPGEVTGHAHGEGVWQLSNDTGQDLDLSVTTLLFIAESTSRPSLVSVNDPLIEFASFISRLSLFGAGSEFGDAETCATRAANPNPICNGESNDPVGFAAFYGSGILPAGQGYDLLWTIDITGIARVVPVPEPGALGLLAASLVTVVVARARTRGSRKPSAGANMNA